MQTWYGEGRGDGVLYKGPSMAPFFRNLDFLFFLPYSGQHSVPGDVVVFLAPDTGEQVVHRVISNRKGTIRTQGDNNREPDSFVLGKGDIRGKVVLSVRGGRKRRVWNGSQGRWLHLVWQCWLLLFFYGRTYARPAWHMLAPLRPLRWLKWGLPEICVVCFTCPQGVERRAFMGRLHVATLPGDGTAWRMNRWGKLILNPRDLLYDGQCDR